ncbi:proline-rich protein 5-like isoform X3 [Dermacentor andersoni]|uniref:proline-rich protein 5-like isoform X3 n=1 Tax=Dermacentor andersoni TaxID=34620 RepID=UPI002417956C|nr:uncharacterized protein LOC126540608 isoform X3 [Dermacentor andersoni]
MMSHLLHRSFRTHRRTYSTPAAGTVTSVPDRSPRNTLPASRAALTDVPEHEELRSGGRRHGSLGFVSAAATLPGSVQEAKVSLTKYAPLNASEGALPKNRDWLRILGSSKAGPFLFDSFKREIELCFTTLLQKLQAGPREKLLQVLSSEWENLFRHVLPTLDMILYVVKGKGSTTVRQAFLVVFRDAVVTKLDLEELINEDTRHFVPDGMRHMLLILYNVSDSYPPTKTKLKLEGLLARLVVPFLGFQGLYEGKPEPTVKSAEPEVAARRKSADGVPLPRKLSRPMSSQPRQIETLHELFLTALRKQPDI